MAMEKDTTDKSNQEENDEDLIDESEIDDAQFEDPPDFVDNLTDRDVAAEGGFICPIANDDLSSLLVVDNVPEVGQEKLEKLKNVITRIFGRFGNVTSNYFPQGSNGKTKGYRSPPSQEKIEPNPFVEEENLRWWLQDPDCADQYAMQFGHYTGIYWNSTRSPTLIIEREHWTESAAVKWTPKGTYLATCHDKGIILWGGKGFDRKMRFTHRNVKHIDFSPCERYLVSFSPEFLEQKEGDDQTEPIIIWDVRTGKKKRGFYCEPDAIRWPVLKWSHDGKYFARITKAGQEDACISVYDTETCGLLDKKSIKIPCVKDFSWSPGDHVLAFWVPEVKDIPARVTLMQIPTRNEIRSKNLFSVADCKMFWQSKGDYLCVQVSRMNKNKKISFCNFEIFHVRQKLIPVDNIELRDTVVDCGIEPGGSKLVVIHGEGVRSSASFYELHDAKGQLSCLRTIEKVQVNTVSWSPNGRFVVLAQLRTSSDGVLEFYDSTDITLMGTGEHFKVTDINWDPTGRYIITGVSSWAVKMDAGYTAWSFQGKCLRQEQIDNFGIISWRPRPPTLLSAEEISRIKKDLKKYQRTFDAKDRMSQSKASKELVDKRRKLVQDYTTYREQKTKVYEREAVQRMSLRYEEEEKNTEDDYVEEVIEVLVKEELFPIE
ncbi:Eukaryotic translation initiation factor 3 subunit B [Trichoplax sp. H2]|nr:Eukaryotic translation initiation factor 3 subunit B [Trichoplax sp. H2]|eukprot:RDD37506.1 Eukaryotic translation initiation factor 3 subunit B [Trichoplax sp. H2]